MRIVHVIPDVAHDRGGSLTAVLGMAEAQSGLSHKVSIVTTDYGRGHLPVLNNVDILRYRCRMASWRWSPELKNALPRIIEKTDIVHIHTVWEYPSYASAEACRKASKPYIIRPCGMLARWSLKQKAYKKYAYLRCVMSKSFRDAAAFHFTSERERDDGLSLGYVPRGFVVPLGLHASALENRAHPKAFHKRFPMLEGRRFLLFLGRLDPKKLAEVAIEAFGRCRSSVPELCLVIGGSGDPGYLNSLKELATRLGLEKHVFFTGLLKGEAVMEAYAAAHLFVLPSLHENFGISVAEAMAAGCPVIISDQVDLASYVERAEAGLVGSPDVASFAGMISELIGNEDLRLKMGNNGRELVLKKFTWEKVAGELMNVYDDLLTGRRESPAWGKDA